MMTSPNLPLAAIVFALAATPLAAQQNPQDFTLPPNPTPTPTPNVEGPVDDSGLVPIGPRVIPTATPTPLPTPAPMQTVRPAQTPAAAPTQRITPTAQPSPRQTATPTPAPGPAQTNSEAIPESGPSPLDNLPAFTPEQAATGEAAAAAEGEAASSPQPALPEWWPWVAGIMAALGLGALGGWWIARRRSASTAPEIEPPVVRSGMNAQSEAEIADAPVRISTTFEVERLTRSMMVLTLKYRLTIANRSDRALRNLSICADLVSARRHLPVEQQLAAGLIELPANSSIERVGPHQSTTVSGELRLPLSEIEIFQQGQVPLCVPLARLRIECAGSEPHLRSFLVGLESGAIGGKLHPLPLNGPPGGYEGAQARPLD